MSKRRISKPANADRKRTKPVVEHDDDDIGGDFFLGDDDNAERKRQAQEEDEEEAEEAEETAEEKRLRLARAYLERMRAQDDEDDGIRLPGADDGEVEDHLGARLAQEAAETLGRVQRKIAKLISVPAQPEPSTSAAASRYGAGRFVRCHRLAPTAVALTSDDTRAFTVSKDGSIFAWDVETMKRTQLLRPGETGGKSPVDAPGPEWVKKHRQGSRVALYAAAVSSDGRYLAVGGGDNRVHVFDAASGQHVSQHPGHRDIVTGLAFREGTQQLLSCSFDRTIKLWSLSDNAYMDTLFGHQQEVLSVDILRAERAVSSGADHSCRVWKIPEESQLIYRSSSMSVDCVKYITPTEWVSGAGDGALQLWSQLKKRPVANVRHAHGPASLFTAGASSAGAPAGDGCGWVQSVASCRGADVVASGAGDGMIRLWGAEKGPAGGLGSLWWLGGLPARGFVNGLALARSGRFVLAAMGQEPRLGRWVHDGAARNGLLMHRLTLADEPGDE